MSTTTANLSQRELEVIRTIARAGSEQAAAAELGIATNTVRVHRQNAYHKLGAHTAREAWVALGWMRLPDGR